VLKLSRRVDDEQARKVEVMHSAIDSTGRRRPLTRIAAVLAGLVVLLAAAVVLFPWDTMRGPINRYVSQKTGRHFAITRHLDVTLGRTARVRAEGIEFANPTWARDPYLLRADAADLQIRLWPLLHGQVIIPNISLSHPQIGLQEQVDGRRTWNLTPQGEGHPATSSHHGLSIGRLSVDDGQLHYIAAAKRVDVRVAVRSTQAGENQHLPIRFEARGTFRDQPFQAEGSAGNLLQLTQGIEQPYPAEIHLQAADTIIDAKGSVARLVPLGTVQGNVRVQGRSLADLYHILGVVLPETPRYILQAHLSDEDNAWHATQIRARLGASDLSGELTLSRDAAVPTLTGSVMSEKLDFDDLAPLVGLAESRKSAQALPAAQVTQPSADTPTARPGRVLPNRPLDLHRLSEMNADVKYTGARIVDMNTIPVDSAAVHVRLEHGVLQVDPMDLGFAGGRAKGRFTLDGNREPAASQLRLELRNVDLTKLVSGSRFEKYISLGRVHGQMDLRMRGNSTAAMLASADGSLAMLMGSAHMSKIASQAANLHIGELLGLFVTGDRDIQVRCAAAAFDVRNGLMRSRALLFDSADTALYGDAEISMANEQMNLVIRQYPKERSVLSLRSPLRIDGSLAKPAIHAESGPIAAKGGAAFVAGALNPLLALAATVETAPGKDADCTPVLKQAAGPTNTGDMARAASQAANSEITQGSTQAAGATGENKPGFWQRLREAFGARH
jgi:AsmA family protein